MKEYIVYYTLRKAQGNVSTIYTMTLSAKNRTQAQLKARDEFICTPYKVIKVRKIITRKVIKVRRIIMRKLFWTVLTLFVVLTYFYLITSLFIDWWMFI